MLKVKYIQFKLSNIVRAWISRKVCRHIMPKHEPMGIYISGMSGTGNHRRIAFNGISCLGNACRMAMGKDGEWNWSQCLESYRCMNSGIKVWTNSVTGAVVIQNISEGNLRV